MQRSIQRWEQLVDRRRCAVVAQHTEARQWRAQHMWAGAASRPLVRSLEVSLAGCAGWQALPDRKKGVDARLRAKLVHELFCSYPESPRITESIARRYWLRVEHSCAAVKCHSLVPDYENVTGLTKPDWLQLFKISKSCPNTDAGGLWRDFISDNVTIHC